MMTILKPLLAVFFITSCITLHAAEDHHLEEDHEEHSAHVHGHATSQITFIDETLNIELLLPSIDVFGFEHEPQNDNEHESIINAKGVLESTDNNVSIYPTNACKLDSVSVESNIFDVVNKDNRDHDGHDSEEHDHSEAHHHDESLNNGEHSDVSIRYQYSCPNGNLESINYNIFDHFSTIEEIEVQFVSNQSQKLFTATPNSRELSFN